MRHKSEAAEQNVSGLQDIHSFAGQTIMGRYVVCTGQIWIIAFVNHEWMCSWLSARDPIMLGPNWLICSFSSGASPAHNAGRRVLVTIIQPTDISHKKSWQAWWQDDRHSLSTIVDGFFWILYTRHMFVSVMFIVMFMMPIACLFSVADMYKSNKFYHRKSMRAVNEKLIINKLGP